MGFIDNIISVVVNIVESFVDLVIDVVEVVLEAAASLLGYEDQIIEQFEVYNRSIFEDSQDNPLQQIIYNSILGNEDLPASLLFHSVYDAKANLRRFVQYIEQDKYFQRFPTVEGDITYVDEHEVLEVLNELEGEPCSLSYSRVGTLFANYWIQYWLATNKDYNIDDHSITHDAGTWYVAPTVFNYQSDTDTFEIPVTQGELTSVLDYEVPGRPVGSHYIVYYYLDSAPTDTILFIYAVGSETHPELDDPSIPYGRNIGDMTDSLRVLPAIPLRIDNANFNTVESEKATQISELTALLGLDAADMIKAVMEDPNVVGNEDKLDHAFINFGVKIWDTTQISMNYCFRLFQNMYVNAAVTEGLYRGSENAEKPYNSLKVTSDDYAYIFKYAYITYVFTSRADIDKYINSPENDVYYSDMSRFVDGSLLNPYYSSDGKPSYNIGFIANDEEEVDLFLAGNGRPSPGATADEAVDYLQVTSRMLYGEMTLKPDLAYENIAGELTLVNKLNEATTSGQAFTFYQITHSGLAAYTIHAPIAMLRVVDAQTDKFKLVKFNLANKNDLTIPLIYELMKDLPKTQTTQLLLASAHLSIYTAHYEVIEMSFFQKLLAVVQVALIIYGVMTFNPATLSTAAGQQAFIQKMVIRMLISEVISYVAKEISPELAAVLAVVLITKYAPEMGLDTTSGEFWDIAEYLSSITDAISNVINIHTEGELSDITKTYNKALQEVKDATNVLKDIQESLFKDASGAALSLLDNKWEAAINPLLPDAYYAMHGDLNPALSIYELDAIREQFLNPPTYA
jgi:hypothetical protein